MDTSFSLSLPHDETRLMAEQNRRLTEAIARESGRLGSFIRRRVPDPGEAEDILQDVFFELVEAWRLPEPIEQVGAWLFRVARHRIVDRFRKRREEPMPVAVQEDGDEEHWLEAALPADDGGPEAAYLRRLWLDAIATALEELAPGAAGNIHRPRDRRPQLQGNGGGERRAHEYLARLEAAGGAAPAPAAAAPLRTPILNRKPI